MFYGVEEILSWTNNILLLCQDDAQKLSSGPGQKKK